MSRAATRVIAMIGLFTLASGLAFAAPPPRHFPRGQGPAQGFDVALGFRVALVTPEGESRFWDDTFDIFTGDIDDFEDAGLGVDLRYFVSRNLSVDVGYLAFEGDALQGYVDADIDPFLQGVEHTSELRLSPLLFGATIYLGDIDRALVPYVGAGGGFYFWRYREVGDFVLFDPVDPANDEIITTAFEAEGATLGYYLKAGIEVTVRPHWSVFVEGRWHRAEDEMADDFDGEGDIDLSAREVAAGFSLRF